MNLVTDQVLVRAIERNDMTLMHRWANLPEIQYLLGGWHFPTNMNDQMKWFETLSCTALHQRFMVEDRRGEIIGMCNLVNINFKDGNAELGLLLDPQFQGQGYGKHVVFCLMNYAFNELRFNRLDTSIIANNEASLKLFLGKCGWKQEGIVRNWYFRNGRCIDKVVLGILREEFAQIGR